MTDLKYRSEVLCEVLVAMEVDHSPPRPERGAWQIPLVIAEARATPRSRLALVCLFLAQGAEYHLATATYVVNNVQL